MIINPYIACVLYKQSFIKHKIMGTLTKIQEFFLGNLNNSEYVNHMNRFRALFQKAGSGGGDRPEIE